MTGRELADDALARATELAEASDGAWVDAERQGQMATYAGSDVPCYLVAMMFAQQAQAWAAIAAARHASLDALGRDR
jgi:hypothetical protein